MDYNSVSYSYNISNKTKNKKEIKYPSQLRNKYSKELKETKTTLRMGASTKWQASEFVPNKINGGLIKIGTLGKNKPPLEYIFLHELGHAKQYGENTYIIQVHKAYVKELLNISEDYKKNRNINTLTAKVKSLGLVFKSVAMRLGYPIMNAFTESEASAKAIKTAFLHDGLAEALKTGKGLVPSLASYYIPAAISATLFAGVGYGTYAYGKDAYNLFKSGKEGKWVTMRGRKVFIPDK